LHFISEIYQKGKYIMRIKCVFIVMMYFIVWWISEVKCNKSVQTWIYYYIIRFKAVDFLIQVIFLQNFWSWD